MARDAIDRCKVCGTPYLSSLKEGETDADRICYTCHPAGPSKPKDAAPDDEFVLTESDNTPRQVRHADGDARQQIVRQIRTSGRAAKTEPESELPKDVPDLPPRRRRAELESQGSPVVFLVKVVALIMVTITAGYFAFETYTKSQESAKSDKVEVPPVPVPEPPPAPIPVAPPRPKQIVVAPFKPDNVDGEWKPPANPPEIPKHIDNTQPATMFPPAPDAEKQPDRK